MDKAQRFIFDNTDVRGELVQLDKSYQQILAANQYPTIVANLLGEFLVASVLLSSTIKFAGRLTLQARSQGQISLLMAESTHQQHIRGIARVADEITTDNFLELFDNGSLAVTIEPDKGERYQSIVPFSGTSLASCLEHYFQQSEQLNTLIKLSANAEYASGMLVQQLPEQRVVDQEQRKQQWQHIVILGQTLKNTELLSLENHQLLSRLYPHDAVRLLSHQSVSFQCSCSFERSGRALMLLEAEELQSLFDTTELVQTQCEFCGKTYKFSQASLTKLLHGKHKTH
ncbi:MAG: Hsp33 family molecular chaperone HslO [Pseudomonadales bacterium]|nr:Hsp33 family molecular chaperone HslO [Pseudomonadales bacterium]